MNLSSIEEELDSHLEHLRILKDDISLALVSQSGVFFQVSFLPKSLPRQDELK